MEEVERLEIRWQETASISSIQASFVRGLHNQRDREELVALRAQEAKKRRNQTYVRRTAALEAEEQKKRLIFLQQEELHLEASLRMLEKDIQGDVFNSAYDAAQRMKYFMKTMGVIVKNEAALRREIVGAERYEWLLDRQRCDTATVHIQKEQNLLRRHEEQSTIRRHHHNSTKASRRALGTSRCRSPSTNLPKSKIDDSLGPLYYQKSIENTEVRERQRREAILNSETKDYGRLMTVFDYSTRLHFGYEVQDQPAMERLEVRILGNLEADEAKQRSLLETEQFAAWNAILRRMQYSVVDVARQNEYEVIRQRAHDRRIDSRQHRIKSQQHIFHEKLNNSMPGAVALFPQPPRVLTPVEPPTTTSKRAQQTPSLRTLLSLEKAEREAVAREETSGRCSVRWDMDNFFGVSRKDVVAMRRRDQQQASERKIVEKIVYEEQRSTHAKLLKTWKVSEIELESLLKAECNARICIVNELRGWTQQAAGHATRLAKLSCGPCSIQSEEEERRYNIERAEYKNTVALFDMFYLQRPNQTVAPLSPLPPPKTRACRLPQWMLRNLAYVAQFQRPPTQPRRAQPRREPNVAPSVPSQ